MNQTNLIRDIWNEMIATPKNKNGSFQLQPKQLEDIVYRHLGKPKKEVRYKPFQVNQTYQIKWAIGGNFTIKEIKMKFDKDLKKDVPYYFLGIIEGKEHLGLCPLNIDRLTQKTY